jgi:hypothetical protein
MPEEALFRHPDPSTYVPTDAAVGAWDRHIVHGAAVTALFAGRLTPRDPQEATLARLTVDFLAPVPQEPLTLECGAPSGGSRVARRHAALEHEGRLVATATAVHVRRTEVDLPPEALDQPSPFDPAAVPALDEPHREAEEMVGWPSFDSRSMVMQWLKVPGDRRPHQWVGLAVPVVEGTDLLGTEVVAVAADYGQTAVSRQLPYASWSFRNAEVTIHLSRPPQGTWVGLRSECVAQPVGAGFNSADLFDAGGRLGRSSAAIVVERR